MNRPATPGTPSGIYDEPSLHGHVQRLARSIDNAYTPRLPATPRRIGHWRRSAALARRVLARFTILAQRRELRRARRLAANGALEQIAISAWAARAAANCGFGAAESANGASFDSAA